MNVSSIIKTAIVSLSTDEYDVVHDIRHHYDVWKRVISILHEEKLSPQYYDELQVASWFHDYETYYTESEKHKKLISILKENSVDSQTIDRIIAIIDEHHLAVEQNQEESKILFDADKLEGISIYRWTFTIQAYKDGLISENRLRKYMEVMNADHIEKSKKKLYFDYSRSIYSTLEDQFLSFAKQSGILKDRIFQLPELK